MEYRNLGNTNIKVSVICLGTMTWGEQNTQQQAFEQINFALEKGVNFIDTAEMYPVPPMAKTQGATEEIIGNYFEEAGNRDKFILATKVTGKSEVFRHLRGGQVPRLNKKDIGYALEQSLKRLKTDYIDLYQIHWSERTTNCFGELGYKHVDNEDVIELSESLEILSEFVKQGKIRHIGLSNETPWGVLESLRTYENGKCERIVSVQNPYNLLNRSYEIGMSEISIREECGLLAYSPMAFGILSGKFLNGAMPQESRIAKYERFKRYKGAKPELATERYCQIAKEHNITPAQMSLAFVNQQRFVTSNIIGATTLAQLEENIDSINVKLNDEIIAKINEVHNDISNPCP